MDGRHKTPPNALDLAGKRFGKLVAVERAGKTKKTTRYGFVNATAAIQQ